MRALVIETATERGVAAVIDNGEIAALSVLPFGHQNSRYLLPEIERLLKELNLEVKDLDYIASGTGPGSYTGMRVGAIAAKTLSFACRIPLIGICTLQAFVPEQQGRFSVVIDAKIGGLYIIKGKKTGHEVEYLSSGEIIENKMVEAWLGSDGHLVTPFAAPLKDKMIFGSFTWEEKAPDPIHIGKIAQEKFQKGEFSVDGSLTLQYFRRTQAEIERDARRETAD